MCSRHVHSQVTDRGGHLQERCSDIWMCGERDNSDDGDTGTSICTHTHTHQHTHNNLFLWHTREENIEILARRRSMGLCGFMARKGWAKEGGISYWDLSSAGLLLRINRQGRCSSAVTVDPESNETFNFRINIMIVILSLTRNYVLNTNAREPIWSTLEIRML